jgi:two-component system LytT family sensor kinase
MTPGTPLTDRPAVAEPEGSTWWDDERAFVGRRPTWSLILLVWLIPATVGLLQMVAANLLRGTLVNEWPWALLQIPRWLTWVPITPIVFYAADRFPFRRDRLARSAWTHLGIALVIAVVIEVLWLQISFVIQGFLEPEALARMQNNRAEVYSAAVLSRLLGDAFIYAAVLGVATTLGYHRRLRERELRAANLEAQLALAQVQALKMQVHPHFLFNTLHAVTVLIREDPAAATRVVTRLGDLLRLTLSRATTPQVSFRRELEILTLYLEIERTRFHDRLEIAYDVQPATLGALVPDLILQPLVENAIRHGVSPNAGTGRIEVRSRRDGDWLNVEIRDNGAGLTRGHVRPDGIGLTTTRARLERLYNDQQELTLANLPDGGCVARIRIPFQLTTEDRGEPLVRPPLPATSDAPLAAAGD